MFDGKCGEVSAKKRQISPMERTVMGRFSSGYAAGEAAFSSGCIFHGWGDTSDFYFRVGYLAGVKGDGQGAEVAWKQRFGKGV